MNEHFPDWSSEKSWDSELDQAPLNPWEREESKSAQERRAVEEEHKKRESELKRALNAAEERARENERKANTDGLTGIPNVAYLNSRIEAIGADERKFPISFLFLDLNGFKPINDIYGHDAGDDVLRAVAGKLEAATRPGDVVVRGKGEEDKEASPDVVAVRKGGDEFVILALNTPQKGAETLAQRLRAVIASLPVLTKDKAGKNVTLSVTTSIGVATAEKPEHFPSLLKEADERMYKDKEASGAARGNAPLVARADESEKFPERKRSYGINASSEIPEEGEDFYLGR